MDSAPPTLNGNSAYTTLDDALARLSPKSRACIERLAAYRSPAPAYTFANVPPKQKLAAVLVLLFERDDRLLVLLTTRSKQLRSHPGQTALPGGKVDPGEKDPFVTARREAFEEVGLPLSHPSIHNLALLPPFLSQFKLIVTPCVSFLSDPALLDTLVPNAGEVDSCFFHPLEAVLTPEMMRGEPLAELGGEDWPYEEELQNATDREWLWQSAYRMHRFRASHTPVKGLTADILLLAAEVAYARGADFERYAPGQVRFDEAVRYVVDGTVPRAGQGGGVGPVVALESRDAEVGNRPGDTVVTA